MEQLIPVIEFVKKHRFWLSCGVIAVASLVTWFLATNALHTQRVEAQKNIEQMDTTGNKIIKTGSEGVAQPIAHPNDKTEEGMEEQIDLAGDSLLLAWKARRAAQEPVLQWPTMPNQSFMEIFTNLQPAEKYIEELIEYKMESKLAVYQQEIPKRMKPICDIIGAKWNFADDVEENKENSTTIDSGRDRDNTPESVATSDKSGKATVVEWSEANQELWHNKLTKFKGIDGQKSVGGIPTPIQVIALQQDLWLLEAMYKIIKDVNGDADANDLAVIKRIDHVVFGREARSQLGKLTDPDPLLAPPGKSVKKSQGIPQEERSKALFGARKQVDKNAFNPDPGPNMKQYGPFHGRYVDANFKPIAAKTLQDVLKGEKLPKENLELIVAKRVPVRIALRMDDQKIDDFIAACGNSPFAFEIWQVRIDRPRDKIELAGITENANTASERSDGQQRGEVASGGGGGMNLEEGGAENASGSGSSLDENLPVHLRKTYDVNVEFYGIVKIYNPVDEEIIRGKKTVKPNP